MRRAKRPSGPACPTHDEADWALRTKFGGAKLAAGPWQELLPGRWAVPAVGLMTEMPLGERVLVHKEGGGHRWANGWIWDEPGPPARARVDEYDPVSGANQAGCLLFEEREEA